MQALTQKKTAELADKTKALKANQEKLQQGGAVLNDAARAQTQREIDRLTVEIDRFQEDANAEVQQLQQELQGDFQEKLRPVVDALVKELAIGLLFSAGDAGAILRRSVARHHRRSDQALRLGQVPTAAKPAAPPTAKPAPAAPSTAKPAVPPSVTPPATPPATPKPAPAPAKP